MDEKTISLEIKKKDRSYVLQLSSDSPLGEVYDVLSLMRGYIVEKMKEVDESSAQSSEVSPDEIKIDETEKAKTCCF